LLVSVLEKAFPHPVKTGFAELGNGRSIRSAVKTAALRRWSGLGRYGGWLARWRFGFMVRAFFEWSQFKISDAPISATA
jgi:hypothetical protein